MVGTTKTENGARRRRRTRLLVRAAALVPLVLILPFSTGCSGRNATGGDPLLGEQYRKGFHPLEKTAKADIKQPAHEVPPVPVYRNTSSTAAMAAGMTLPGSRPLAIPASGGRHTATSYQGQQNPHSPDSPWVVPAHGSKEQPMLKHPIPIPQPQTKAPAHKVDANIVQASATVPEKAKAPPKPSTEEELVKELIKRGVHPLRQEKVSEGVRFVCSVPRPEHPSAMRIYEVTAPTAQEAIRAILQKVAVAH